MTKKQASEIVAFGIFSKMVDNIESRILSQSFKRDLKYNNEQVNKSLTGDYASIVEVLQAVVDKFYHLYYEVEGFQPFSPNNFDSTLSHNLTLLRNCKKLLKFVA